MFWWLYGSTGTTPRNETPLVMWLQGGPGASSTGFGNFEEIGPLDVNQAYRPFTWVKAANVLFVDNPVGTGYSYVTDNSAYTTNVSQIADDLLTLFQAFLQQQPAFQNVPFYIFSESYGGKMAAAFGLTLFNAIKAGQVKCIFKGVALGDSWISPVDSVATWSSYLLSLSQINYNGMAQLDSLTVEIEKALANGDYTLATNLWSTSEDTVESLTDNVNFYNVLQHNVPDDSLKSLTPMERAMRRHLLVNLGDALSDLMNGPIRKYLGDIPANVVWGGQSDQVFSKQEGDFMKDVVGTVGQLLSVGVNVTVYSGELDLIVDVLGTLQWINKLPWSGLKDFLAAARVPLYPPSGEATKDTGAFYQAYQNLHFYWILNAGHMVPSDAAEMAFTMLKRIINV
ncbi:hypothetical protein EMCRGX_G028196 [Ephydatia muelleri]|eukprot:Em0020g452a